MTDSYHMGFKDGQQSLINQGYEKVRHGRWIDKGDFWVNCSICDCAVLKNEHDPILRYTENYYYCPNCGAKMNEVTE